LRKVDGIILRAFGRTSCAITLGRVTTGYSSNSGRFEEQCHDEINIEAKTQKSKRGEERSNGRDKGLYWDESFEIGGDESYSNAGKRTE
jgi:hypothetical protein